MLDWDHLKFVLAIARSGSLTAAGHALGVDQTTAGRRLSSAEEQLGNKLFLRSKNGFKLTEAGRDVLAAAEEIETRIVLMTDRLSEASEGVSGIVRLLGNPWMLTELAGSPLIRGLLDANPRLDLRLSGRLPPAPLHGETTLALWFDAVARSPQAALPFARIPYAAYIRRGGGVATHDWVAFRDDDAVGPSFSRLIERRLGKEARIRLTATDAAILMQAAKAGVGRAMLPCCLGDTSDRLERIEAIPAFERVLHLHVNPGISSTRRVRVILDWLRGSISETLGGQALPLKTGT